VHEQPLAGRQGALGEQRVVGGGEDLGHPARLGPVQAAGQRHGLALVHRGQLRLPAAADDRHDAIPLGEPIGPRAATDDLARELEPGDVRWGAGRRGIQAPALHQVGAVDSGGADADEDLAGAGLGVGVLLDEDLAVADGGGAHGRAV
jgi:hypothetical protein